MAMLLLQCARTMTCLWIWLLRVWCGCGASYACAPMFTSYPLFSNVMIKLIPADGAAAWPGVRFSWFLLSGTRGLLCGGFPVSGLVCSGLLLFGRGTWKSMALGFMMQFWILFSTFFEWLWLNSYGNAFS